jgi:hypothetical protein
MGPDFDLICILDFDILSSYERSAWTGWDFLKHWHMLLWLSKFLLNVYKVLYFLSVQHWTGNWNFSAILYAAVLHGTVHMGYLLQNLWQHFFLCHILCKTITYKQFCSSKYTSQACWDSMSSTLISSSYVITAHPGSSIISGNTRCIMFTITCVDTNMVLSYVWVPHASTSLHNKSHNLWLSSNEPMNLLRLSSHNEFSI